MPFSNVLHKSCQLLASVRSQQLRNAVERTSIGQRSPSKRSRRYSPSPDRQSRSPSPGRKRNESPRKRARSKSPARQGGRQKGAFPRKPSNREEGSSFRNSAGSRPSGVCAVCLGRHEHEFAKCNSSKLWNGTKAWARRNDQGRLATPDGFVLCFDWQLPKSCPSSAHLEKHMCSGCGEHGHGAQKCPLAQAN